MRQDALDSIAATEKVLARMRKQIDNMSVHEIDRVATDKRIFENEGKRVQQVTRSAAKSALNDTMEAYKGVRMVKYKVVQGFNVNILYKRGSITLDARKYDRPSRRYRSERSKLIASYWGASRSFVLRIQEKGTVTRTAGTKYSNRGGSGNRGAIIARDFMGTARTETQAATDNIVRQLSFIDELFKKD